MTSATPRTDAVTPRVLPEQWQALCEEQIKLIEIMKRGHERELQARDATIAELRKQLEWQPIETVGSQAKDMDVELLTESGKVRIETVRYALHQIAAAKADGETPFFTHWKPLPAPPEQGEG